MSAHTGNKLIWIIAGGLAFLVLVILASSLRSSPSVSTTDVASREPDMPAIDVEGDTPGETLKSLVTNSNLIKSRSIEQEKEIETLRHELSELASRHADTLRRVEGLPGSHSVDASASTTDALMEKISRLERRLDQQAGSGALPPGAQPTDIPHAFGFGERIDGLTGGVKRFANNFSHGDSGSTGSQQPATGYVRILPLNAKEGSGGSLTNASLDKLTPPALPDALTKKLDQQPVEPRYTIPMNATLYEATAMTALVGRVPVNGGVRDAFEVKFILGRENLAANGLRIPGLSGMIFAGVATGDWNLSCVSADIKSATYVWDDGRIQTITTESLQQKGNKQSSKNNITSTGGQRIGWISTRQGIPCIPGKRISDAGTAAMLRVLLAVGEGYAKAQAESQVTRTVTTSGATTGAVTGDVGEYYKNIAAANAISEAGDIIQERWRETFDAIFVAPGKDIAVNITRTLPVDYDPNARKLVYSADATDRTRRLD